MQYSILAEYILDHYESFQFQRSAMFFDRARRIDFIIGLKRSRWVIFEKP